MGWESEQTLQPVGYVDSIIFEALLVGIGQSVQDDEGEDVETHVRDILERLDDNVGKVVICHDLVHGVGEEDARITVSQLSDCSREGFDRLVRQPPHDVLRLPVGLNFSDPKLRMFLVHHLPFSIELPATRGLVSANHIPDLHGANSIASNDRQGRN